MLGRIDAHKSDEVTAGRRKLYNGDHHTLYSSPNNVRMIETLVIQKLVGRLSPWYGFIWLRIATRGGL
jgi:hypothetical protein